MHGRTEQAQSAPALLGIRRAHPVIEERRERSVTPVIEERRERSE
ncbi:hypothetical protein [Diaminobutyricimonas sp. TR449]|nr:hypothetical protein [Diaminobutyricimonas sp. TR449]